MCRASLSPESSRSLCQSSISAGLRWAGSLHVERLAGPVLRQAGRLLPDRGGGGSPRWRLPTALPAQGCRRLCALRTRRLEPHLPRQSSADRRAGVLDSPRETGRQEHGWLRLQAGPAKGQPSQDPRRGAGPLQSLGWGHWPRSPVHGAALCTPLVRLSLSRSPSGADTGTLGPSPPRGGAWAETRDSGSITPSPG